MSKVLIDRELLERAVYRLELAYDADAPIVCDLSSVLAAPSGTPAMPVKAYYHESPNEYGGLNKSVGLEVRKTFADAPLVLESDALAKIACLEGEIAKRDARIAELESKYQRDVYGLNNEGDPIGGDPAGGYANDNMRLRAEFGAIKAQEPVGVIEYFEGQACVVGIDPEFSRLPEGTKLYAAPVSEAKAQGVVMPERRREAETDDEFSAWVRGWNACLDEVARLNAAPAAPSADAGVTGHD